MAFGSWWVFSDALVETDRDDPGVYQLADPNAELVYIGSAKEVRRRLKEHLVEETTSCIKRCAAKYQIEYIFGL
jgi:excinuclease UvrABC nuclease subunit